jgi:hypothetical protein
LKKQGVRVCTGFIWLRIGISDWLCENDNKHANFLKDKPFTLIHGGDLNFNLQYTHPNAFFAMIQTLLVLLLI